ncbi:MAG: hypothetical protein D8H96_01465 [Lautropia sp.]|nr:MAG: hypothetical protein D8H96_01465 [Lautropia sp.]
MRACSRCLCGACLQAAVLARMAAMDRHAGKDSGGVRFVGIVVDASGRGKPCGFQSVFCVPAYGRQSWEEGAP